MSPGRQAQAGAVRQGHQQRLVLRQVHPPGPVRPPRAGTICDHRQRGRGAAFGRERKAGAGRRHARGHVRAGLQVREDAGRRGQASGAGALAAFDPAASARHRRSTALQLHRRIQSGRTFDLEAAGIQEDAQPEDREAQAAVDAVGAAHLQVHHAARQQVLAAG